MDAREHLGGDRSLSGIRIVVAVTAPSSATFYAGQLAALRQAGADVHLLTSPSPGVARQCADEGAHYLPIQMERGPALLSDAQALAHVTVALRRLRPHIVNAGTPKAGLLGMLAAAAVGVPRRVHTLHGLRYEVATGHQRRVLRLAQKLSCAAATHVICVGASVRDRAIETGVLAPGRAVVLGDGSVNGVDPARFSRSPTSLAAGKSLRRRLGIGDDVPVVGYLGRIARDKGIAELLEAWSELCGRGWHLLLAGEPDATDPVDPAALKRLRDARDITLIGHVADSSGFLAAIDLLVLPTWREGFPTVLLEAAAMEIPAVATRATGCADALVDGTTGTLVPVGDATALAGAITRYLTSAELRRAHGESGRARVVDRFTSERIHRLTVAFYRSILDL